MRIVALVPGGIGDQLLFFPTLDHLQQIYPEAKLDVVVEPRSAAAYRVSKSVNHTILFDFRDRNSLADWGNLLGVLRDREYDVVLSLAQPWGMGFLLWLTGIPTRLGYSNAAQPFFTATVPFNPHQYLAQTYHDLIKGMGIDAPCPDVAVSLPNHDLDWAAAERQRLGIQDGGYVLIFAGTESGQEAYPLESWKGVVQGFQQRKPDIPFVLLQEAEEAPWVEPLMQVCPGLKLTLPEQIGRMVAMIAGASVMISTDGFPLQLAIAAQTYTVALFGANKPERFLPAKPQFVGIKSFTGKMTDIAPQTVLEKAWGS